jgi:hypothetical protein
MFMTGFIKFMTTVYNIKITMNLINSPIYLTKCNSIISQRFNVHRNTYAIIFI